MMKAIDLHRSLIMSLEQLMALAGHLAQVPRPTAATMGSTVSEVHRIPVLSADELAALREIWSTPLRSQMADLCPVRTSGFKH
jgi:hypothetical protein